MYSCRSSKYCQTFINRPHKCYDRSRTSGLLSHSFVFVASNIETVAPKIFLNLKIFSAGRVFSELSASPRMQNPRCNMSPGDSPSKPKPQ